MQLQTKYPTATVLALGGLTSFALCTSTALAKQTKEEQEVEYRQSIFIVMAGNFGPLGAMAEGKMPFNADQAKLRAQRVAFLAPLLKEAFPPESSGVGHTAAKPEIWTDTAGFNAALQALLDKSAALAAAAQTGDQAKITAAVAETGKTCKSCHDKFRTKD
jgi:cytochrome c556